MNAYRFLPLPTGPGVKGRKWLIEQGDFLPKKPPLNALDMLKPHPGTRGYVPRGVDKNAPRRSV